MLKQDLREGRGGLKIFHAPLQGLGKEPQTQTQVRILVLCFGHSVTLDRHSLPPPILSFPNCEIMTRVPLLQWISVGLDEVSHVETPS